MPDITPEQLAAWRELASKFAVPLEMSPDEEDHHLYAIWQKNILATYDHDLTKSIVAAVNAFPVLMDEYERLRALVDNAHTLLNAGGEEAEVWQLGYENWMQQYHALKGGLK